MNPARRAVLKSVLSAFGLAAVGATPRGRTAEPEDRPKISKVEALYVDDGAVLRCEDCSAYIPGSERDNGTCAVVEGIVRRRGGCSWFDA